MAIKRRKKTAISNFLENSGFAMFTKLDLTASTYITA
jgi:hypothetical protein